MHLHSNQGNLRLRSLLLNDPSTPKENSSPHFTVPCVSKLGKSHGMEPQLIFFFFIDSQWGFNVLHNRRSFRLHETTSYFLTKAKLFFFNVKGVLDVDFQHFLCFYTGGVSSFLWSTKGTAPFLNRGPFDVPASQRMLSAYCSCMYLIKYVFYKIIKAFYRTFFLAHVFSHHWTSSPKANI